MIKDITLDLETIKKTLKIDIICDNCSCEFKRPYHVYLTLKRKWNGKEYCRKCANAIKNSDPVIRKNNSIMMKDRMKNMSKEERSSKFGNDSWKNNEGWLKKQKSSEGHGDKIKLTISKMSDEQRKEKYGLPGDLNPMYGKAPGMGSGIGYSGWYEELFFRSKLELSFLLYNNDKINQIKNAESMFNIKYKKDGNKKSYHPDFLFENNVIEIKPYSLLDRCKEKTKAAIKYFKNNKYDYVILTEKDFPVISMLELYKLYKYEQVNLTKYSIERILKKIWKLKILKY